MSRSVRLLRRYRSGNANAVTLHLRWRPGPHAIWSIIMAGLSSRRQLHGDLRNLTLLIGAVVSMTVSAVSPGAGASPPRSSILTGGRNKIRPIHVPSPFRVKVWIEISQKSFAESVTWHDTAPSPSSVDNPVRNLNSW